MICRSRRHRRLAAAAEQVAETGYTRSKGARVAAPASAWGVALEGRAAVLLATLLAWVLAAELGLGMVSAWEQEWGMELLLGSAWARRRPRVLPLGCPIALWRAPALVSLGLSARVTGSAMGSSRAERCPRVWIRH